MKRIPLSGARAWALVDDEDFERINATVWYFKAPNSVSKRAYAIDGGHPTRYMHREILGAPAGLDVDHKSLDGLDNRRLNLRLATRAQNCQARGKRATFGGRPTSSRFKGVGRIGDKFRAFIRVDGHLKMLGRFVSEEDAARCYDQAARMHFGDFARVNFNGD